MNIKCKRCKEIKDEKEFRKGRKTCKECYALRPKMKFTKEWREKISKAKKGIPNPKHAEAIRGVKRTKEAIEKTATKLRGRKYTLEHRLAISKGHKKVVEEGRCHFKIKDMPSLENLRERLEYKIWKEKVLERDNEKCVKCGSEKRLHVHHLQSYYTFPEGRLNIDNGQTLCISCHMKLHNKRG